MPIALKTKQYKPNITHLSSMVHQQSLSKSKIRFLVSPCFLVYYNKKQDLSFLFYDSHSDIPFVTYKVLLIMYIYLNERV